MSPNPLGGSGPNRIFNHTEAENDAGGTKKTIPKHAVPTNADSNAPASPLVRIKATASTVEYALRKNTERGVSNADRGVPLKQLAGIAELFLEREQRLHELQFGSKHGIDQSLQSMTAMASKNHRQQKIIVHQSAGKRFAQIMQAGSKKEFDSLKGNEETRNRICHHEGEVGIGVNDGSEKNAVKSYASCYVFEWGEETNSPRLAHIYPLIPHKHTAAKLPENAAAD